MPERPDGADDEAIASLRQQLVRIVGRVCPGWLSAHAEDIVQLAILKILAARRPGEGIGDLRSLYVRKTAFSTMVDEIRRLRRGAQAADSERTLAQTEDRNARNPEQSAHLARVGEGIRSCLASMAEARRLAVTLHLHGHSVPETSRLGRWSPKQAENLVYRGLADLRRCLSLKGLNPDA